MKTLVATALIGLSLIASLAPTQSVAQEHGHGSPRWVDRGGSAFGRGHHDRGRHRSDADIDVGEFLGFTSGIIVGREIGGGRIYDRRGHHPGRPYYGGRPPRPVYDRYEQYGPRPWSPRWYRWCANAYRSFDPDSGTVIGRDGRRRFCIPG